jgi:hypothetical protein
LLQQQLALDENKEIPGTGLQDGEKADIIATSVKKGNIDDETPVLPVLLQMEQSSGQKLAPPAPSGIEVPPGQTPDELVKDSQLGNAAPYLTDLTVTADFGKMKKLIPTKPSKKVSLETATVAPHPGGIEEAGHIDDGDEHYPGFNDLVRYQNVSLPQTAIAGYKMVPAPPPVKPVSPLNKKGYFVLDCLTLCWIACMLRVSDVTFLSFPRNCGEEAD